MQTQTQKPTDGIADLWLDNKTHGGGNIKNNSSFKEAWINIPKINQQIIHSIW